MSEELTPLPDHIESLLHKKVESSFINIFKKTHLRWFYFDIKKGIFFYREKEENYPQSNNFNNHLELKGFHGNVLEEDQGICSYQFGFRIITTHRTYVLFAETKEVFQKWMRGLNYYFNRVDICKPKKLKETIKKEVIEVKREEKKEEITENKKEEEEIKEKVEEDKNKGQNKKLNFLFGDLHIIKDPPKKEEVKKEIEIPKVTNQNQNWNKKRIDVKKELIYKEDNSKKEIPKSSDSSAEKIQKYAEIKPNIFTNLLKTINQSKENIITQNEPPIKKEEEPKKIKFLDIETLKNLSKETIKNPIMKKDNFFQTIINKAVILANNKESNSLNIEALKNSEEKVVQRTIFMEEKELNLNNQDGDLTGNSITINEKEKGIGNSHLNSPIDRNELITKLNIDIEIRVDRNVKVDEKNIDNNINTDIIKEENNMNKLNKSGFVNDFEIWEMNN